MFDTENALVSHCYQYLFPYLFHGTRKSGNLHHGDAIVIKDKDIGEGMEINVIVCYGYIPKFVIAGEVFFGWPVQRMIRKNAHGIFRPVAQFAVATRIN